MAEWIMITFTGTIAVTTIVYTIFTRRLWRETRYSSDIARYTAFTNYLTVLAAEIEKAKESDPSSAAFLETLSSLMLEAGVDQFLDDVDFKKNPKLRDYYNKLEGVIRAHGVDPMQLPWFRPILERMKGK